MSTNDPQKPSISLNAPKKKSTYFYQLYGRTNLLQRWLYDIFFTLSSWPRLVLEVFIRRNMGERYFSLASVITIALLLGGLPLFLAGRYGSASGVMKENFSLYLFLAAFVGFGLKRWHEVLTYPSVFDLERFSLSSGLAFDFFYEWGMSSRTIKVLLEPAMAIVLGLLLLWLNQTFVGWLLVVCGFMYSMSYLAAIYKANNVVMDRLDEIICSRELTPYLMEKKTAREAKGFEFLGDVPKDPQTRERVAEAFFEDDNDAPEVR